MAHSTENAAAQPWNVDTKTEAIEALNAAHDSLSDAVDCAEEMEDDEVGDLVAKIREQIADLATYLEVRR